MDKLREAATLSIGRAVFFAGFGISMLMLGLSYDYLLAIRCGAILTLGLAALLLWFAQTAHGMNLEDCEAWLLLADEDRPGSDAARRVFSEIIHETYLFFAMRAFAIAVILLTASIVLSLAGVSGGIGS
jgi:hypothetical protein